jgi:4-hydroxy-tetrahydrodipicolinate synthase
MFKGTYTAIITPFLSDGSFDRESFVKLIEDQIAAKIDGIVVMGTTGESPTISPEEHDKIIIEAVETAKGRIKVIAGAGSNSTDEAIERSISAEKAGCDGLLQVSPYYNKPTQNGLYSHFSAIAKNTKLPIILYNIASRCGVNISTETIIKLAKIENIVAVKEASGDIAQLMDVRAALPDFNILTGDDILCLPSLAAGADGLISVLSNFLPQEIKALVDAVNDEDLRTAQTIHFELLPIMKACFWETNPIPIKTILAMKGDCKEVFRLPMTPMTAENREKLSKLLQEKDLI